MVLLLISNQIVEQIRNTVRDLEDSGFLDELAEAPEKAETPQAQERKRPRLQIASAMNREATIR